MWSNRYSPALIFCEQYWHVTPTSTLESTVFLIFPMIYLSEVMQNVIISMFIIQNRWYIYVYCRTVYETEFFIDNKSAFCSPTKYAFDSLSPNELFGYLNKSFDHFISRPTIIIFALYSMFLFLLHSTAYLMV